MSRFHQFVLIVSALFGSWLGMQLVHEAGHVAAAWLTGGRVARVVFFPLTISRTDLEHNPHPLAVAWAGPIVGVVAPLLLWTVAFAIRMPGAYLLRFFAGFCLIANGLYIGLGSFNRVGDCGEMLRHGSEPWQLWLFGVATAPLGLWLWHGEGRHFGVGITNGSVNRWAAYVTFVVFFILLAIGVIVGGG